ncbi:Galactoside O-acetyltransferase [Andreprevotia sp. IGB-42]|uniref:sugar O-acetyltransferase n=1 Tax=Andreprevotia sp. IGB-42 TaxID=2497473 RepID=UPI001359C76F|nr:sugar O-acetyltransferase [Andreprevotia sp. IGB-42]KAF0812281.1 Galactoside O-acetyltransferase [Andreprevotia sp. IGB-42]
MEYHEGVIRFSFDDIKQGGGNNWQAERELLNRFNHEEMSREERQAMLKQMFAEAEDAWVTAPLGLAGGQKIRLGRRVFINSNVVLGGGAPITIGEHTLIGPNVQIMTATHPVDPTERQRWAFWAAPITIGQNVWIGASSIICAGVTIGDHSVIGAGSVVTKDIPACVLAAGNPCKVIRELDPPDMATLYELNT